MVRIVASLIFYTSERSNLFSETTQCPFKLILTKGQFKTLSVEASPLGRCRRLVVFLRPVWVLGVNYSSLYVALETEQLFGEQLIQATPRFEMRCHKYTHMRFAARRGEVRGGRHFRDLKVAETRCLFSDIKKTVWYSLRRDLWKMQYYQSGNVTVAAAEMRIHNAAGNERWRWIKEQWQYNTVDKSCCNFSGVWEWKSQFCLGLFENWKKKKKKRAPDSFEGPVTFILRPSGTDRGPASVITASSVPDASVDQTLWTLMTFWPVPGVFLAPAYHMSDASIRIAVSSVTPHTLPHFASKDGFRAVNCRARSCKCLHLCSNEDGVAPPPALLLCKLVAPGDM